MMAALKAGFIYFVLAFTAGFLLGTVRTLIVAPALGELTGVVIELPLMLATSWFACRWVLQRESQPLPMSWRTVMGFSAFLWLMVAEALLSVTLLGRSLAEHFALFGTLPVMLGLAGQLAFAVFPAVQDPSSRRIFSRHPRAGGDPPLR
jgi:hypothetical protein